ncbi:MAG: hypothetical protein IKK81_12335 [Prevotella sp.]|nr:hypothetical protein [Prevotella sp.]
MRLFIIMTFTILCLNISAQDSMMLTDNPYWIYNYDFDYDENNSNTHSKSTYGIGISVKGEKSIKGKIYKKLYLVALQYAGYSTRSTDNGDANYALALREEGGKVLVDYDEYMNYLRKEFVKNNIIPRGDSLFIPYHKTQEGELVLYDFNMQIGDKYSHIEGYQDISVVDINQIVFEDGKNRKLFTLSNGAKIIEGIGCINSCGLLFDYLNPSKPSYNNDKQHFAYLSQFSNDDMIILYEDIITNIPSAKDTSFLVDGRTWNYEMQDMVIVDSVNLKTENVNRYFKLKIDGDTIFKNVNCKKIYYIENDNTSLYGYAYEDGLKVYFYFLKSMQNFCSQSNSWELFFDFGIKKDEVFCSDLAYMSDVDTIEVKGNRYVRYWIGPKKNDKIIKTYPIIHSIGGFGGLHDNTFVMVSGLPTYSCMSIYDGSKCVFEPSDYWVSPITTSIKNITTSKPSTSCLYDMQGRKVKNPTKGLYIKEGKKVLVK